MDKRSGRWRLAIAGTVVGILILGASYAASGEEPIKPSLPTPPASHDPSPSAAPNSSSGSVSTPANDGARPNDQEFPDPPKWATDASWYRIELRDVTAWLQPGANGGASSTRRSVFAALRDAIPYAKSLGATGLILDGLWHGMGTGQLADDFRHVDDRYAGGWDLKSSEEPLQSETWKLSDADREFFNLISTAHTAGLRVVVSAQYSSISENSPAWTDVTLKGKASPYVDWFKIADFGPPIRPARPDNASGWVEIQSSCAGGIPATYAQHVVAAGTRWTDPDGKPETNDGVDGWCITNVGSFPGPFWMNWSTSLRAHNQDVLLLSETRLAPPELAFHPRAGFHAIAHDTVAQAFASMLKPEQGHHSPARLAVDLQKIFENRASRAVLVSPRSLDDRGLSTWFGARAVKPANKSDNSAPTEGTSKEAAPSTHSFPGLPDWKLATAVQSFLPGAPITIAGEETGIFPGASSIEETIPTWVRGQAAPNMEVESATEKKTGITALGDGPLLLEMMNALRIAHPPTREGEYRTVMADDSKGLIAFGRKIDGYDIVVLANFGNNKQQVELKIGRPGQLVGILTPELSLRPKANRLKIGGGRQFVSERGTIDIAVRPMGLRIAMDISDEWMSRLNAQQSPAK